MLLLSLPLWYGVLLASNGYTITLQQMKKRSVHTTPSTKRAPKTVVESKSYHFCSTWIYSPSYTYMSVHVHAWRTSVFEWNMASMFGMLYAYTRERDIRATSLYETKFQANVRSEQSEQPNTEKTNMNTKLKKRGKNTQRKMNKKKQRGDGGSSSWKERK